jgi:hypothetical protein
MIGDIMNELKPSENGYKARTRKNVTQLFCWTVAWGATCALVAFGRKFLWDKVVVFTLLAIALNICVGIRTILINKKYLDERDDLQRKVQLNSFAITVGVAIIAAVPYSVMDSYHMIPFHADVAHLVGLIGLTYAASNLYGTWRYR